MAVVQITVLSPSPVISSSSVSRDRHFTGRRVTSTTQTPNGQTTPEENEINTASSDRRPWVLQPLKVVYKRPVAQLRSVTCRMGSHSVTGHRRRWTRPALIPAKQAGTRYLPTPDGWKAELTSVLVYNLYTEMVYQSHIQVVTTW